jgi:hypothetical protein
MVVDTIEEAGPVIGGFVKVTAHSAVAIARNDRKALRQPNKEAREAKGAIM